MVHILKETRGNIWRVRAEIVSNTNGLGHNIYYKLSNEELHQSRPQYGYCLTSSSLDKSNPLATCSACFLSKNSNRTSWYRSLPLYLETSSPQLLTALASRPGTYGSSAISVIGWKYVLMVKTTPPLLGKRLKDCLSDLK